MKIICYLLILLLTSSLLLSQETTFSTTIDFEQNSEGVLSILPLEDSSYILVSGYLKLEVTDSTIQPLNQGLLTTKIDSIGQELWTKSFYREEGNYFPALGGSSIKTTDNHILFGGSYSAYTLGEVSNCLLAKFNLEGDTIWTKRFGDAGYETGYRCIETSDGNYAMTGIKGFDTDSLPYHYDAYLVKTDTAGQLLFEATYGEEQDDYGLSLFSLPNDELLLSGSSDFYSFNGGKAYHIRQIDQNGEVLQEWILNQEYGAAGGKIIKTKDDNLVYSNVNDNDISSSPNYKRTLNKIDTLGNEIWKYDFLGNFPQVSIFRELADSSFILCGLHDNTDQNVSYGWLARLSKDGELMWEQEYYVHPNRNHVLYDVQPTLDGGFIAAGRAHQIDAQPDMWVLKVNCHGELAPASDCPPLIEAPDSSVSTLNLKPTKHQLSISPNPAYHQATIYWPSLEAKHDYHLHIYQADGRLRERIPIQAEDTAYDLAVHGYPAGLYWVMLYDGEQLVARSKLVVLD